MAARPPPARPHIGINPSFHHTTAEWGEDDAWDSTSDSESPRQSTISTSWLASSRSASVTTSPKSVPKAAASSSTLALSYTHLSAPSPSSYPPRAEEVKPQKSGWTIVRKSTDIRERTEEKEAEKEDDGTGDVDEEAEMVVGELDPEIAAQPLPHIKPSLRIGTIRDDVDDIVHGPYENTYKGSFWSDQC